jgi:hypothetical protein
MNCYSTCYLLSLSTVRIFKVKTLERCRIFYQRVFCSEDTQNLMIFDCPNKCTLHLHLLHTHIYIYIYICICTYIRQIKLKLGSIYFVRYSSMRKMNLIIDLNFVSAYVMFHFLWWAVFDKCYKYRLSILK